MKRLLPFLILCTLGQLTKSQTVTSNGRPFAEIFTNFHYNLNDTSKTTGFGLDRVYVGYNYTPAGNFSAMIIVNLGMVNTRFEDFQQGFWGKRYLGPEFEAIYGYCSVADLGIVVDYQLNDLI